MNLDAHNVLSFVMHARARRAVASRTHHHCARAPRRLGGVWVGAHPSLGEHIVAELLRRSAVPSLGQISSVRREVSGFAGTDMRADFVLTQGEGEGEGDEQTVLEVKTVVDTDYDPATAPQRKTSCFLGPEPYTRAAIFPWGRVGQKGPDGEKVVSARAIKHVRELAAVARGERVDGGGGKPPRAAILFLVARADAAHFRPNEEACPSFARHLREARDAGVAVLAHKVRWGEGREEGKAFCAGPLPVHM